MGAGGGYLPLPHARGTGTTDPLSCTRAPKQGGGHRPTDPLGDQLSGRSVWLDKAYLEDEEAGDLIDLHHFVGYELYDAQQGTLVGAITALDDTTLNTLLRVEPPSGGELVVPIADELIEHVEVGAHRLYLFIPDGLLEL